MLAFETVQRVIHGPGPYLPSACAEPSHLPSPSPDETRSVLFCTGPFRAGSMGADHEAFPVGIVGIRVIDVVELWLRRGAIV